MSVILSLFLRGRSRFQPPEKIAGVLRFIGRHTLEIYAIQPCGLRNHRMVCAQSRTLIMIVRDPIKNFEFLWKTFLDRYPFFELRKVDWKQQFEIYRAKVTNKTNDDELFEIFCDMLGPLNDGHVELIAKHKREGKKAILSAGEKTSIPSRVRKTRDRTALQNDREDSCRQWVWVTKRD